jgi:hypothetical protein
MRLLLLGTALAAVIAGSPTTAGCTDADGDGFFLEDGCAGTDPLDCDDANPAIHPGAIDPCNDVDEDCDGLSSEACRWVDCDDGDDANDGLSAASPMRTLNAALAAMGPLDPFCPALETELHLLPGTCPSEGGILLWARTAVLGAGMDLSRIEDEFVLASREDPICEERHTFSSLNFVGTRGTSSLDTSQSAILRACRSTGTLRLRSPQSTSDLDVEDSTLTHVEVGAGAWVRARRTRFLGNAVFVGLEDSHLDVEGCTFSHLRVSEKVGGAIRRSTFRADDGTALVRTVTSYGFGDGLLVSDSLFDGYDHAVDALCSPGLPEQGTCAMELRRCTFAGASGDAVVLRVGPDDTSSAVVEGSAFADLGGAAIRAESGNVELSIVRNNFDLVDQALCVDGVCYGSGAAVNASGWGAANLDLSSGFVAPGDYHLLATSPLVDAGALEGAPGFDLDGSPRPVDGDGDCQVAFDLGADEFTPSFTPPGLGKDRPHGRCGLPPRANRAHQDR